MKKKSYIAVMGTMGCGKTTAARLISRLLNYSLVEENFEDNVFLSRFYRNMQRWAFHSQIFFLTEKMKQTMTIDYLRRKNKVIQDTPIYQDVYSYAKAQHVLGHMDKSEWHLYGKIFSQFEPTLPKPDCIVFLSASLEELKKRIKERGREYEQSIPDSYLEILDRLNREWITEHTGIPIITIDTDHLNFARDNAARSVFLEHLTQHI